MIATLLEKITGKDDVERVAYKEGLATAQRLPEEPAIAFPEEAEAFS